MIKYFYRLILVVFLIVGGQAYGAKAPANATLGTQATLSFLNNANVEETVLSNLVIVTVNPVYSITVGPGITSSAFAGERISFPTKITNNSNIETAAAVYLANGDDLLNVVYTVDTNGNGILDEGETTVLETVTVPGVNLLGVMTPVLPIDGEISLIVTGTIPTGAVVGTTENYIVHGRILAGDDVVDFNESSYLIKAAANVEIVKSIEETKVPGAYVYTFRITNNSPTEAQNIVLTDNLPATIELDGETGVWVPFHREVRRSITVAEDGYEANANQVDFSVVNGVMTLKIKTVPAGENVTFAGGYLHFRVRPKEGVAGGTAITNTASYTFDNGTGVNVNKNTNTVVYTVPQKYGVTLDADMTKEIEKGAAFTIPQVVRNTGNTDDTYTLSVSDITNINNLVFYLDDNGDGIRQETENTVITETTVLQTNEEFKFFVTGEIKPMAPDNLILTIKATSKTDAEVKDKSIITIVTTTQLKANIIVTKGIGETEVPNAFVYTFEIKNTGEGIGKNLIITDMLSDKVELDAMRGKWIPFGSTTEKLVTIAADGYESSGKQVNFSVVNGLLTLKVKNIPAGENVSGGVLKIRVKPKATTLPGTVINNTASFTYNNGVEDVVSENTNTVSYTVPMVNLVLEKFQAVDANKDFTPDTEYTKDGLTINPGEGIFYKLVATNTGNSAGRNITITDIIPQYTGMAIGNGTVSMNGKPVWRINGGPLTEITNVPAVGEAGNIEVEIPQINPGDIVEVYYNVKVTE